VALADLEDDLRDRHDVASVPVEQPQASKPVGDEVLAEPCEQAEVDPRWGGEGAREVEVVVDVPQPSQGREQDAVFESLCDAADDFAQELAVGEERHVVPALLQGRDGWIPEKC